MADAHIAREPGLDATLRLRDTAWMAVIHQVWGQERCWCGDATGHAGWLNCAKREADRLTDA